MPKGGRPDMPETSPFSAGCQRFADLPPELAAAIFSRLSLKERHRAVPLCCRRWCLLAHMPVLLERVSVDVRGLARLQSLCAWLMFRAAGHMRELGITFCATHPFYEEESNIAAADLAAALAVCGAAGGLTLLRLFVEGMRLGTGAWLPLGLHQLRHLMLRGHTSSEEDEVLYFPSLLAPLTSMGDLETLWLEGSGSGLPDLTAGLGLLPVSLKRLHLAHPGPPALQSLEVQLPKLTRLSGLSIPRASLSDHTLDGLCSLSGLEALSLQRCNLHTLKLPGGDCLCHLTSLRTLNIADLPLAPRIAEQFLASLGCLGHLTFLRLPTWVVASSGGEAALLALEHLELLALEHHHALGVAAELEVLSWTCTLPALRQLGLNLNFVNDELTEDLPAAQLASAVRDSWQRCPEIHIVHEGDLYRQLLDDWAGAHLFVF